jgi:hypothetical protein
LLHWERRSSSFSRCFFFPPGTCHVPH